MISPVHPWWHVRRPLAALLVLSLIVLAAFSLDAPVLAWLAEGRSPLWKRAAAACSKMGDWPVLAAITLGAGLWARWRGDRRMMKLVCLMLLGSILAGAVVNPVRALTGRARPNARVEQGWHGLTAGGRWTAGQHKYSAFPSAHTAVAAGFIAPLVVLGPRISVGAWMVVLLVGWSRVYLGVHHLSDVAVGVLVGRACGFLLSHSALVRWWLWRVVSVWCGRRRHWPAPQRTWALPLGASRQTAS